MAQRIKKSDPDRWIRARTRATSGDPGEDTDTETEHAGELEVAPADEDGFPAVRAINTPKERCTRTSPVCLESRVGREAKDSVLVARLGSVDVVEAFSPPRVSLEAKKFGLKPGEAWDLTTGWDFRINSHREAAERYVEEEKR